MYNNNSPYYTQANASVNSTRPAPPPPRAIPALRWNWLMHNPIIAKLHLRQIKFITGKGATLLHNHSQVFYNQEVQVYDYVLPFQLAACK